MLQTRSIKAFSSKTCGGLDFTWSNRVRTHANRLAKHSFPQDKMRKNGLRKSTFSEISSVFDSHRTVVLNAAPNQLLCLARVASED